MTVSSLTVEVEGAGNDAATKQLVLVKWLDSSTVDQWQDWEDVDSDIDTTVCYSVGWLKEKNDRNIVLFSNSSIEDDEIQQISGIIIIPIVVVQSIQELQPVAAPPEDTDNQNNKQHYSHQSYPWSVFGVPVVRQS
jgi:hypothetical protein